MKKLFGSVRRGSRQKHDTSNGSVAGPPRVPIGDGPEAVVVREISAFCEAGAPGNPSAGDEYLHLPAIVDAAESSPSAAKEAALCIQRYLSKQNFQRGYAQYNAIMLMRILTDNPGRGFTQNFDKSFVNTMRDLLRECRDSSVQQITRETLDHFEVEKVAGNDTLAPLIEMWRREKGRGGVMNPITSRHQVYSGGSAAVTPASQSRGLPPPTELAGRIEEARTSARLLIQMVQSTPQNELPANELVREFAERAREAHKSVQRYMACEDPAPDDATMMTLIETSEQLNIAMTKHQRALLQARKALGQATPTMQQQMNPHDPFNTNGQPYPMPQNTGQPSVPPQPNTSMQAPLVPTPRSSAVGAHEQSYTPPPGPPPSRRFDNMNASGFIPAPVSPPRDSRAFETASISPERFTQRATHPQPVPTTAASEYGVSENPFADHNAYAVPAPVAQPLSNSYSAIDHTESQTRTPRMPIYDRTTTAELDANPYPTPPVTSQARPGYVDGYGPTNSFMHRQESSADHLTMHGADTERR